MKILWGTFDSAYWNNPPAFISPLMYGDGFVPTDENFGDCYGFNHENGSGESYGYPYKKKLPPEAQVFI